MLDSGSELSLIRREVAEKLDLLTTQSGWSIESWRPKEPLYKALSVNLLVSTDDGSFHCNVDDAQVVDGMNFAGCIIDWDFMKRNWPQPHDLDLPVVRPEEVGVLIGQDVD